MAGALLASGLTAGPADAATRGQVRVITYNVAGLPEGISQSRPVQNLPLIGGLLNSYDLALVQEDFAYPTALRERLRLPYGSAPFVRGDRLDFGDGLSAFSKLPLTETRRATWRACHGYTDSFFDCLTPKGYRSARVELAAGVSVDVYNLHMDAGRSSGDRAARARQLEQLIGAIQEDSAGRPLIVAGDFNLGRGEGDALAELEDKTGLRDSCRTLGCPEPGRIDRILVRGTSAVRLFPVSWRAERRFVDKSGHPLSDHLPVVVELGWERARDAS
jgi:endonuclease/exonuclease/phosphatase family metal-dependent hydrolase